MMFIFCIFVMQSNANRSLKYYTSIV